MKFGHLVFSMVCATLTQSIFARPRSKCPECATSRKHGRREQRNRKSMDMPSFTIPRNFGPDSAGLRLNDAQTLKFLEEFVRKPNLLKKNWTPSIPVKKYPTNHYTEAVVDAARSSALEDNFPSLRVVGKFGYHSRHQNVRGRVVHVRDVGRNGSHFGCSGDIANKNVIVGDAEPWIALVSRGKCTFLVKIKLAEKFNASAVIVYDTEPHGDVEVMRTIGTKIPSLMVNATSGKRLANLAQGDLPVYATITVGAINIKTTSDVPPGSTNDFTKAIVDFQSKQDFSRRLSLHKTTGVFGTHSPQKKISAKVVHISDPEQDSHYGCSGRISNENEIEEMDEEWVALVAGGKCYPLAKIMLAEKYSASAVVIYETKFLEEQTPINAVGANITALTIGMNDGRKALELIKDGVEVYLDIDVMPSPRIANSVRGEASSSRGSNAVVLLCLILAFLILVV